MFFTKCLDFIQLLCEFRVTSAAELLINLVYNINTKLSELYGLSTLNNRQVW